MSTQPDPSPDPAAVPPMPQAPPSAGAASAGGTAAGRRRRRRLSTWQTVIAAVIGAAGAVAAAVIPMVANSSTVPAPAPSPHVSPTLSPPSDNPAITISTVSQTPAANGATRYTFTGTSSRTDSAAALIFVIAQNHQRAAAGGTWLVSPAATVAANGNWSVTWNLSTTPPQVKWVAVIYDSSCRSLCATAPPATECRTSGAACVTLTSPPDIGSDAEEAASELAQFGPEDAFVVATNPPPSP